MAYLRSVYAPVVNYYGAEKSRASILAEKSNFIRRWPIRQTAPLPGAENPTISCNGAAPECEINGLRSFEAISPDRRARAAGIVRYSYRVRFLDGQLQIVAEDSEVVRRTGVPDQSASPVADQTAAELTQK